MSNLINSSFFVLDINIPNPTGAVLERLTALIARYEPECLLKILGYPLYKLFGTESSQRMTDLISGAEYYDSKGALQKWQGLVHGNVSLIANYIYYQFEEIGATQTTGVGTSVPKAEAAKIVSPADKMINAWNFFSHEVYDMTKFLWFKSLADVRIYPEFTSHQFFCTRDFAEPNNLFGI